jgi:hypothetical protein
MKEKTKLILIVALIVLIIGIVLLLSPKTSCQLSGGTWNEFYQCCCPAGCPISPPANWAVLYPQCTCCYLL